MVLRLNLIKKQAQISWRHFALLTGYISISNAVMRVTGDQVAYDQKWMMETIITAVGLIVEVVSYWANRIVNWIRYRGRQRRQLQRMLHQAKSYDEWNSIGEQLDAMEGKDVWREVTATNLYDTDLIQARLQELRRVRNQQDSYAVMFALRAGLIRNYGGIGHKKLYSISHVGTKRLLEDYYDEILHCMHFVANVHESKLDIRSKLDFFTESQQSFGRTALLLNGGASFGLIHLGVVKALFSVNMLPKIISGTSIGALVAALVCVTRDEDMPMIFEKGAISLEAFRKTPKSDDFPSALRRRLQRLLKHGVLMDVRVLEDCLKDNIGDITFEEAYFLSGRILNIMVNSTAKYETPRLYNYLTSPNVVVRSAACASLAVPGLYEDVDILAKDLSGKLTAWRPPGLKWTSISVEQDLPINRLSELFNVNHFISVQVSPHIVPFLSTAAPTESEGLFSRVRSVVFSEFRHRLAQLTELRLLPSWTVGLLNTIAEIYKGDIIIIPSISVLDYKNIIAHPTDDVVQASILKGESSTWPHLNLIYHRLCIEMKLDEIIEKLKQSQQGHRFDSGLLSSHSIKNKQSSAGQEQGGRSDVDPSIDFIPPIMRRRSMHL